MAKKSKVALMLIKQKENKLINELVKGEQSGFAQELDRKKFINEVHNKYVKGKISLSGR
jgi:hypothetical protein